MVSDAVGFGLMAVCCGCLLAIGVLIFGGGA